MISNADTVLDEGLSLMRNFLASIQQTPPLVRGGVLTAFQGQLDAWTDRAEAFLASNPGTPIASQSKLRSAIAMADDIADQSPNHVDSLLVRVQSFLGTGAGPAPVMTTPANTTAPPAATAPASKGNGNMLLWLVLAWLVFKG